MDSNLIRLSAPFTLKHTVLNKSRKSHSLPSFPASRNSQRLISFRLGTGSSRNDAAFDDAAFEAERLRLDAKAREAMAEASKRETSSTSENEDDPKAWKWVIRKRIWDLMEARNIAQNPRPVHHRIPNFVGAATAAQKVIIIIFSTFFNLSFCYHFLLCCRSLQICSWVGWKSSGSPSVLRLTRIRPRNKSGFSHFLVSYSFSLLIQNLFIYGKIILLRVITMPKNQSIFLF
jgi:hypothetical protein